MYRVFQRVVQELAGAGLTAFLGDPPDAAPPPYVFVWGDFPVEYDVTLAQSVGVVDVDLNVTCVDSSPANVLRLAAQVEATLRGCDLNVGGWFVEPVRVTGSTQLRTERGVTSAATNRLPAGIVLHLRVRAAEANEKGGASDGAD